MKKEIQIKEIRGIKIGQAENRQAGTGCTVVLSETGMAQDGYARSTRPVHTTAEWGSEGEIGSRNHNMKNDCCAAVFMVNLK